VAWKPGDHPLTDVPGPVGELVAGGRARGWDDERILRAIRAGVQRRLLRRAERTVPYTQQELMEPNPEEDIATWWLWEAEIRRRYAANLEAELEAALAAPEAAPPKSRRGLRQDDEPLLDEMAEMIRSGAARNANDAATKVAACAQGAGTQGSKIARLARRYRDEWKRRVSES